MSIAIISNAFADMHGAWDASHAVLERSQPPTLVPRDDKTGANNTINLFIDGPESFQYAASVVEACPDRTVYAIRCTTAVGSKTLPSDCAATVQALRFTEGPSVFEAKYIEVIEAFGATATATYWESCALKGTTQAVCAATIEAQGTTSASTTTLASSNYHRFDVQITGGAEKTANPTGTCKPNTPAGNGASVNAASGIKTRGVTIFSLLGAIGVVAFLSA